MLEKKVSDADEQKAHLEAELQEKIKKMEKDLENSVTKASGKYCCKKRAPLYFRPLMDIFVCLWKGSHAVF